MTIVCLFGHTDQGNAALHEMLEAGLTHEDLSVIGDIGPAASQPGAEHHVTFDALHVPVTERGLFMDTIRAGGVVLGVTCAGEAVAAVEKIAWKHHALNVVQTSVAGGNPSHNVAE